MSFGKHQLVFAPSLKRHSFVVFPILSTHLIDLDASDNWLVNNQNNVAVFARFKCHLSNNELSGRPADTQRTTQDHFNFEMDQHFSVSRSTGYQLKEMFELPVSCPPPPCRRKIKNGNPQSDWSTSTILYYYDYNYFFFYIKDYKWSNFRVPLSIPLSFVWLASLTFSNVWIFKKGFELVRSISCSAFRSRRVR